MVFEERYPAKWNTRNKSVVKKKITEGKDIKGMYFYIRLINSSTDRTCRAKRNQRSSWKKLVWRKICSWIPRGTFPWSDNVSRMQPALPFAIPCSQNKRGFEERKGCFCKSWFVSKKISFLCVKGIYGESPDKLRSCYESSIANGNCKIKGKNVNVLLYMKMSM